MLDQGKYRGAIREWGFSQSKGGTPRFEFTARLSSAIDDSGEVAEMEQAVSRTVFLYLSPKAAEMSAAAIRSLGYTDKTFARLDPDYENPDDPDEKPFDLSGVEVTVRVAHEEWEGKTREKVELERGFSRRVKPTDLSAFEEASLAFAAAQEKESSNKQAAEEPRGRRKKRQAAASE